MKTAKKLILITLLTIQILLLQSCTNNINWQTINKNIQTTTITTNKNTIFIIKIKPNTHTFAIYQNKTKDTAKTLKEIKKITKADIVLNGSFFTKQFTPTGLLISAHKLLHKINHAHLTNGIATINDKGQYTLINIEKENPTETYLTKNYQFAIQNGPILIDKNGNIKIDNTNKKTASRTIIAKDKDENILLIFIIQSLLKINNDTTLYNITNELKNNPKLKPLKINSALNLDGGQSTGVIINDTYYPELTKIQNAITITKK